MGRQLFSNINIVNIWVIALSACSESLTFTQLFMWLGLYLLLCVATVRLLRITARANIRTEITRSKYPLTMAASLAAATALTASANIVSRAAPLLPTLLAAAAMSLTLTTLLGRWAVRQ